MNDELLNRARFVYLWVCILTEYRVLYFLSRHQQHQQEVQCYIYYKWQRWVFILWILKIPPPVSHWRRKWSLIKNYKFDVNIIKAVLHKQKDDLTRWYSRVCFRMPGVMQIWIKQRIGKKAKILMANGIEVQNWDKINKIFANSMYGEAN